MLFKKLTRNERFRQIRESLNSEILLGAEKFLRCIQSILDLQYVFFLRFSSLDNESLAMQRNLERKKSQ